MNFDRQKSNQKIAAWFIAIISISVIIVGTWRIYLTVTEPFIYPESNSNSVFLSRSEQERQKLAELQLSDTDQDGINDFDELYAYDTSPYLFDSDSDGIHDKEELEGGTNPNCPEGEECGYVATASGSSVNDANSGAAVSADDVRNILKNAGASESMVNGLTDQEVLELYYQTVEQTGVSPLENTNQTTTTGENANTVQQLLTDNDAYTLENLRSLSADEIREFMKSTGIDTSAIDDMDDETVVAIFNQALDEELGQSNTVTSNSVTDVVSDNDAAAIAELRNLSASEIRVLMEEAGIDESLLNSIDDASLVVMFNQTLDEELAKSNININSAKINANLNINSNLNNANQNQ